MLAGSRGFIVCFGGFVDCFGGICTGSWCYVLVDLVDLVLVYVVLVCFTLGILIFASIVCLGWGSC